MAIDLTTTNILLGILATVSVLEAIAVVGLAVGVVMLFRRMTQAVAGIEQRQLAPAAARVNEILDDVKCITGVAKNAAERTEHAAGWWRAFRRA